MTSELSNSLVLAKAKVGTKIKISCLWLMFKTMYLFFCLIKIDVEHYDTSGTESKCIYTLWCSSFGCRSCPSKWRGILKQCWNIHIQTHSKCLLLYSVNSWIKSELDNEFLVEMFSVISHKFYP